MNCEEASLLISARIDDQALQHQEAMLDAHLAECEACRQALSEMELQDAALTRAFLPRQQAALDRVQRVLEAIPDESIAAASPGGRRFLKQAAGWIAAAAAGFLVAMASIRPAQPARVVHRGVPLLMSPMPVQQVARLTLATGDVFTCPSSETTWRPIAPSGSIDLLAAVRTADSKCELQLPDGSCVRLNSGTEARFTGSRAVSVSAGELWSAVPRDAAPLSVSAGQTCVTARGAGNDRVIQFNLARAADAATVTVQRGVAEVVGNGPPTTVYGGQMLRAPSPSADFVCSAAPEPLLASRWQDELLILKSSDDPEVMARVDQFLTRISLDRGSSDIPGIVEQDIRARGQAWSKPLACYLRNQFGGDGNRLTAAQLLADLAPPSTIPDLISLLTDTDGQVRYHAAAALRRLTGQTLGYSPDRCAASPETAAVAAWTKWWEQNQSRYRSGKSSAP